MAIDVPDALLWGAIISATQKSTVSTGDVYVVNQHVTERIRYTVARDTVVLRSPFMNKEVWNEIQKNPLHLDTAMRVMLRTITERYAPHRMVSIQLRNIFWSVFDDAVHADFIATYVTGSTRVGVDYGRNDPLSFGSDYIGRF